MFSVPSFFTRKYFAIFGIPGKPCIFAEKCAHEYIKHELIVKPVMGTEIEILLKTLLHGAVCTFLFGGILLWMRRRDRDKSRIYLAVSFFLTGMIFLLRLLASYAGLPPAPTVLPIVNLYGGVIALLILYFYPIEVISPGWLTFRKGILIFAPCWLLALLLAVVPFHFRVLHSFGDLWEHITEFNVLFRLAILIVCIAPYCFLLFYIPYNYKRSSANYRWIFGYTAAMQGIGVLYILFMLTGSRVVSMIHVTVYTLFGLFVVYQELYWRIPVPDPGRKEKIKPLQAATVTGSEEIGKKDGNLLRNRLGELMETEQPWRNPDLSMSELVTQLGTDPVTLLSVIRQGGYENYKDFINHYRIDGFMKIVRDRKMINIQDAFFQSGFRSKSTALRYFKKYTGTTPTDYLQREGVTHSDFDG